MLPCFTSASVVVAASAGFFIFAVPPAVALTMKECSAKYEAAKQSGTLEGKTWLAFRKAYCGTGTPAEGGIFPKAISPKYAKESAGKARLHTCLDQYKANKAANLNGGLVGLRRGVDTIASATGR
jgi:hypothetical protein